MWIRLFSPESVTRKRTVRGAKSLRLCALRLPDWGESADLGPVLLHNLGAHVLSVLVWGHWPLENVNLVKREERLSLKSAALGKLRPEDRKLKPLGLQCETLRKRKKKQPWLNVPPLPFLGG